MSKSLPIVLGFTGASGALYGVRLLDVLLASGREVHVTISPSAVEVFRTELDVRIDLADFRLAQLAGVIRPAAPERPPGGHGSHIFADSDILTGQLVYHHFQDFSAGIASGSFRTAGMVVCPCSMGTLAAISQGLSTNLIQRAADVHLKERRKLIVVPRETPLGSIQLANMKTLADAGGVILPAMPGFYHRPTSIQELVDFVVSRICDQLGVEAKLGKRWGEMPPGERESCANSGPSDG